MLPRSVSVCYTPGSLRHECLHGPGHEHVPGSCPWHAARWAQFPGTRCSTRNETLWLASHARPASKCSLNRPPQAAARERALPSPLPTAANGSGFRPAAPTALICGHSPTSRACCRTGAKTPRRPGAFAAPGVPRETTLPLTQEESCCVPRGPTESGPP